MADPAELEEERDEEEGGGAPWLTTWADMMSVLLTFFIVLQAFSTISERKFYEAISSIQSAFRVPLPIRSPGQFNFDIPTTMAADLEKLLDDQDISGASVEDYGDRIVLTIESKFLFGLGSAALSFDGEQVMEKLAASLRQQEGDIRIEGHTCDLPLGTAHRYRDNWELSTERALAVLGALSSRGVRPERLGAAGYAEFRPIAPNDSEVNRARNRRVEFVIETKDPSADDRR